jgi:hypothetical protein
LVMLPPFILHETGHLRARGWPEATDTSGLKCKGTPHASPW